MLNGFRLFIILILFVIQTNRISGVMVSVIASGVLIEGSRLVCVKSKL